MKSTKLKQFKAKKETDKKANELLESQIIQGVQDRFFNKYVPIWQRWLMMKSKWFRDKMSYQVAIIDNDPTKLMLYRQIKGKNKILAKTF